MARRGINRKRQEEQIMANLCKFNMIIKGKKNACFAFAVSTVCSDESYIREEHGAEDAYYVFMEGAWNWEPNYGSSKNWTKPCPVSLPDDCEEAAKLAAKEYSDYTIKSRSRMFQVEVQYNYAMEDSPCHATYVHLRNGVSLQTYCPDELRMEKEFGWRPAAEVNKERWEAFQKDLTSMPFINFRNKQFVATGFTAAETAEFRKEIVNRGGTLTTEVCKTTYCLIVNPNSPQPDPKFRHTLEYRMHRITDETFWELLGKPPITKTHLNHNDVSCINGYLMDVPESAVTLDLTKADIHHYVASAFYSCTKLEDVTFPQREPNDSIYEPEFSMIHSPVKKVTFSTPFQLTPESFNPSNIPEIDTKLLRLGHYHSPEAKKLACRIYLRDRKKYEHNLCMKDEYHKYMKRIQDELLETPEWEAWGRYLIAEGLLAKTNLEVLRRQARIQQNAEFLAFLENVKIAKPKKDPAMEAALAEEKKWTLKTSANGSAVLTAYKGLDTDVTIPDSIKDFPKIIIGERAFSPMAPGLTEEMVQARRQLRRVVCSDAVVAIHVNAFSGCDRLEEVILSPQIDFTSGYFSYPNTALNCADLLQMGITQPAEFLSYLDAYRGCNEETFIVPNGVVKLGGSVFYNGEMREIILPDGLLEIGDRAFSGCRNLQEIVLPDGLLTIGNNAFSLCKKLEKMNIPNSVISIGFKAFNGCSSLTDLWIGADTLIQEASQSPGYPEKESPYSCSYNHLNTHITIHTTKGSPASEFARKYGISLVEE